MLAQKNLEGHVAKDRLEERHTERVLLLSSQRRIETRSKKQETRSIVKYPTFCFKTDPPPFLRSLLINLSDCLQPTSSLLRYILSYLKSEAS